MVTINGFVRAVFIKIILIPVIDENLLTCFDITHSHDFYYFVACIIIQLSVRVMTMIHKTTNAPLNRTVFICISVYTNNVRRGKLTVLATTEIT